VCRSWNFQSTSIHESWPMIRVRSRTAVSKPQWVCVHNICSLGHFPLTFPPAHGPEAWRLLLHIMPLVSLLWMPTSSWNVMCLYICKIVSLMFAKFARWHCASTFFLCFIFLYDGIGRLPRIMGVMFLIFLLLFLLAVIHAMFPMHFLYT